MAEMILPQKSGKRKVHSLKVDLTPMVDLGFLLITFFMLTTTMAQPKAMDVIMPDDQPTKHPTPFVEEATITLIPSANHSLYYYNGLLKSSADMHIAGMKNARDIILRKKSQVAALPPTFSSDAHQLHVLIKPDKTCKYEDLVSLLDEMNINSVKYYAIVDISAEDVSAMAQ
jgi:biopolymer transport protein ExbD